ncbi:hypothetical protein AAG570_011644 [Ranatra chinensis]|uniref:FAM20 C-terminal domain-containing protein n=1 Tax=Ranatra chinensis TaxID=642074 RepID=A0ABD0YLL4_9HEMI
MFADVTSKGTQLKILLTLEGGQKALFKPKWYEPSDIIEGNVYAGKDRHNGEIISFHLARLLGLNRVPIVTRRVLNLRKEILPVSSDLLKDTFHVKDGNTCFYGVCIYCKKEDSICGSGDMLEGSISLWLPENFSIKKARHPWQRSYSEKPASWEINPDYCQVVKNSKFYQDEVRLLDLIETSIFDFLIDNGDRHHYEFFSSKDSKVLLIDNAKSFGNPFLDHIDILAPLYQCCRIRKEFLSVLVSLQNGALSSWLIKLLRIHKLENLLHSDHFEALDRRLNKVLSTVMVCFEEFGSTSVISD